MGYLTVLHVRFGAKFGDLHAKDSSLFCKRQILSKLPVAFAPQYKAFSDAKQFTPSSVLGMIDFGVK